MSFTAGDGRIDLRYPDDFVASSARLQPEIEINNSEVVFVGYGVVAPDYEWDDYKNVDVCGKTLLMLIGDPPIPDPKDPSKLDEKKFKGKAMTYYGRWTYKYEIAAQKGAAAAVIIHETGPAGYPYSVVKTSWAKENYVIDSPNKNMDAVKARSWITLDAVKKFLTDCGQDFDALKKAAITKEFRADDVECENQYRNRTTASPIQIKSHNVISKLEGSDPKLRDEYVITQLTGTISDGIPSCKATRSLMVQSIMRLALPLSSSSGGIHKTKSAAETVGLIHGHDC
jgi:Zn-dependent M28 family amino/carboxypeptidase